MDGGGAAAVAVCGCESLGQQGSGEASSVSTTEATATGTPPTTSPSPQSPKSSVARRRKAAQGKAVCTEEEIRKSWFVVQCRSAQEESARARLQEQGYEAYLPKVLDRRNGKDRVAPLFPCYLFIHFDPFTKSMRPVASTRGVVHMIQFAYRWAVVPASVIDALRSQENEDGLRVLELDRFRVGEKVKLVDGPFVGMVASVVQDDSRIDYVVVSLDWIRRLSVARGSLVRAFSQ